MKTLVIAEKPDMGRNIAAAIEPRAVNKRTHLVGQDYIITWAIGHLVGLAEPDHYDSRYKKWRLADLPIVPESFHLVAGAKTASQLKIIAELARSCDRLINACDAGREGQYIFHLIQRYLKLRQPVQRLWISDLTPETIRRGFAELRDGADFENLTRAAKARSEADWLIGMNGSRAFTTKHNVLLSVGRVQTPVLALIYDRQHQIEAFTSTTFYEVYGEFEQEDTRYRGIWQGGRVAERKAAEEVAAKVNGQAGRIAEYAVKETRELPPKLYDLTLLQRDANAKFGYSAKKTLDLAQSLYEKHKAITYPRTNANYVTEANIPEMHRALDALRGTSYDRFVQEADRRLVNVRNGNLCNPAKVEDHHAILPTAKRIGSLPPEERRIYDLIVRRFLSHYYPPARYNVHAVLTEAAEERFKTTVKELVSLGWKVLEQGDQRGDGPAGGPSSAAKSRKRKADNAEEPAGEAEETDEPFRLRAEAGVVCRNAEVKEKMTQPPKPYTEGTLLKAMESAGKQVEDEALREAMKESGLGTPATRAATIERLKQVGYIQAAGKRIAITQKGRMAVELIRAAGVDLLTSPEMTGHWERRLNEIARGEAGDEAFMQAVVRFARKIVDQVRSQTAAALEAFGETGGSGTASDGGRKRSGARGRRGAGTGKVSSAKAGTAMTGTVKAGSARAGTARAGGAPATVRATLRPGTETAAEAAKRKPAGQHKPIGPCPRVECGGTIILGRKGYGCSHYKSGCRFVVWKSSQGKNVTEAMMRSLLAKGQTNKFKIKSAEGDSYDARLILADTVTGAVILQRL